VPHPPIHHPRVWGEPLPVFCNYASHTLGSGLLPDSYNISEQLQLSQYDGFFIGHPMYIFPPGDISMTCPIPGL
jgi:hypothetical protein